MGQKVTQFFSDDGRFLYSECEPWNPDPESKEQTLFNSSLQRAEDELDEKLSRHLLKRCSVVDIDSVVVKHSPHRIVLACCRVLYLMKKKNVTSPAALAMSLLLSEKHIVDHTDVVLPNLKGDAEKKMGANYLDDVRAREGLQANEIRDLVVHAMRERRLTD